MRLVQRCLPRAVCTEARLSNSLWLWWNESIQKEIDPSFRQHEASLPQGRGVTQKHRKPLSRKTRKPEQTHKQTNQTIKVRHRAASSIHIHQQQSFLIIQTKQKQIASWALGTLANNNPENKNQIDELKKQIAAMEESNQDGLSGTKRKHEKEGASGSSKQQKSTKYLLSWLLEVSYPKISALPD